MSTNADDQNTARRMIGSSGREHTTGDVDKTRRVELAEGDIVLPASDVRGLNGYLDRIDDLRRARQANADREVELVDRLRVATDPAEQARLGRELEPLRDREEELRREIVGALFELRGYLGAALGRGDMP